MNRSFLVISALTCFLAGPECIAAEWVKVDDFQSYPQDNLPTGAGAWTVPNSQPTHVTVSPDLLAENTQAIKLQRRSEVESEQHDILYTTGAVNIAPGQTGTVFLRFMVESGHDQSFGSASGDRPQMLNLVISLTNGTLTAGNPRAGIWIICRKTGPCSVYGLGSESIPQDVVLVRRNQWYRLWLVVENTPGGENSAAYVQEEGTDEEPKVVPGAVTVPSTEGTTGLLNTVGVVKSNASGLVDAWFDDFYVDNSGVNLRNPLAGAAETKK